MRRSPQRSKACEQRSREVSMRKRRAIVFDDEESMLTLYKNFFLSRGYEVFAYADPVVCPIHAEYVAASSRLKPCADVLITDYKMPRMNGLDLLNAQSRHGCRMLVMNKALISGFVHEELRNAVQGLGYAFFSKPVKLDELESWITECEQRVDLSQPLAAPRKEERHSYSEEMPCLVRLGDRILSVLAVNSSRSGLCLKLTMPLLREQIIRIHTELSIASPTAAVRWVSRLADGSYLAGLNFL